MKAKEFISTWLDKKYGGGKELGDWTPEDVSQFADDYANELLKGQLKVSNELLRSADSIAGREGKDTDWAAFQSRVKTELKRQHPIVFGRDLP